MKHKQLLDRIIMEQVKKVLTETVDVKSLESFVKRFDSSLYVQEIRDHNQTHAVYGLTPQTAGKMKDELMKIGASKFRSVKNSYGNVILCFNATKIKL